MKRTPAISLGIILAVATGADIKAADLPTKAKPRPPAAPEWTGFYLGSHLGYAGGTSDFTASDGTSSVRASSDFFAAYDPFKGTGSYLFGLQGGYNWMPSSRIVLGVELDASAPNTLAGRQTALLGPGAPASYRDTVLDMGTARGRLGYLLGNDWLVYGTGGLAWAYDRLERSPLGTADVTDTALFWRLGWVAGVGVEVPILPSWTAKLEFQSAQFGHHQKYLAAAGQTYNSDLSVQRLLLGINYQLGADPSRSELLSKGITAAESENFALHGQTTFTTQYASPFRAPYAGQNSLGPNQARETFDLDLFVGFRPWQGGEIWINPEIDQGFGLSGTFGVAGFPSAEAYKVGATYPYARLPRAFLRQTIDLGGETQKVDSGQMQFAGSQTADRLVFTVGKFGVVDIFDSNKYAHDPRGDFLNWTLVNTGSFDYAADAWAFTYGAAAEWYTGPWTLRAGFFDGPTVPNGTDLDPSFSQHQIVGEIERRYEIGGQPGKLLVTGYWTTARMGSFQDAIDLAAMTGTTPDLAAVRSSKSKGGISANLEQQLIPGIGLFARAGYTPGRLEAYAFTDVDTTFASGLSVSGQFWNRPNDTWGIAGVVNSIASVHQAYLAAGGYTAIIGDGQLPHPGREMIFETYYTLPISTWMLSFDYQFIANPAYNRDRGPVSLVATRLHTQF